MKSKSILIAFFLSFALCIFATTAISAEFKQGDNVKIITPGTMARLCPHPNCGTDQHITRIPKGTILVIDGITDVKSGLMSVKWFEVKYKKKRGWISIYDTDKQ